MPAGGRTGAALAVPQDSAGSARALPGGGWSGKKSRWLTSSRDHSYIGAMSRVRSLSVPRFPADAAIDSNVSKTMRAIRSNNTKPEIAVRSTLHALGYRFRLHRRDLPGTPDIVLPKHRFAIFVHGCFWHQHAGCRHAKLPRLRQEYWLPKLSRTQHRDKAALLALQDLGWRTLVIWECGIKDHEDLKNVLRSHIKPPNS